jgi:class 3 adenylate cyclase/tetratricopeptide (TPR) repeat protein
LDPAFSVYIPADRRQALARGEELPAPGTGAVLSADISGFTALTEALTRRRGPRQAAEELARQLDHVYNALIGEVDRYGGSVIGFSGDAITCWFGDDPGVPDSAVLRAAAGAFAMQAALDQVGPPLTGAPMAAKIALAAGPIRRLLVGNPALQVIDVLAGATLTRLIAGEHLAARHEIVLDPVATAALGPAIAVREWRTSPETGQAYAVAGRLQVPVAALPVPPGPAVPPEQARSWLLPAVYARLQAGQGEFLTELRPAVALFLHFADFDYEADGTAGARLDAYIRWVQDVLNHYDGSLLQVTIGEKGSYLYAAFGAPLAHEDDARRAVAAARTLLTPPPAMEFAARPQIGLSLGTMRVGSYGGATRRTYGAMGDEVNRAARLMELAAPGEILASGPVAQQTRHVFGWDALPPLSMRGRRDPGEVYRLHSVAPAPRPAATSPLVGRAHERQRLAARVQALQQGMGGVVILEGEPGIGKSRLLADLEQAAQAGGLATLLGRADAVEATTPYHAWRPVFTQVLGLAPGDDPDAGRQRVLDSLAAAGAPVALAPLLTPVLPFAIADNEQTAPLAGPARAEHTHDLLLALLQAAVTGGARVLMLDDAQWLDSASLALAQAARQRVHPLLLVLALRPPAAPAPPDWTDLRQSADEYLPLRPLPAADIATLVAMALGVERLPEPVTSMILDKAAGHPLFSEELACSLRDSGLLVTRGNTCLLAPGADLRSATLPPTLQAAIIQRIDCLSPSQQTIIKVAGVIGQRFLPQQLQAIYPAAEAPASLDADLAVLDRLDLTPRDPGAAEPAYHFKHIVIQEAAYSLMLASQRRPLHRAVAEWYEATYAADPVPVYPLLAHHWRAALEGAPPDPATAGKAIDYLQKAGEQAARNNANVGAAAFYQDAVDLLPALPETAERNALELALQLALAGALSVTRGYSAPEVKRAYDRARALTQEMGPTPQRLMVLGGLIQFYSLAGEWRIARDLAADLVASFEALGDPTQMGGSQYGGLSLILYYMGELAEARVQAEKAIVCYDPVRHRHLAAVFGQDPGVNAYNYLGAVLWTQGFPDQALVAGERALALARELAHLPSLVFTLYFLAGIHLFRREVAEGLAYLDSGDAEVAALGDSPFFTGASTNFRAMALAWQGDGAGSLAQGRRGLAIYRASGSRAATTTAFATLGQAHALLGQYTEGLQAVGEGLDLAESMGEYCWKPELFRVRGELLLGQDPANPAAAEAAFQQAIASARRQQARSLELRAAVNLARLWRSQRPREAEALLREIYDWFTEGFATPDLREARALLDALRQDLTPSVTA